MSRNVLEYPITAEEVLESVTDAYNLYAEAHPMCFGQNVYIMHALVEFLTSNPKVLADFVDTMKL